MKNYCHDELDQVLTHFWRKKLWKKWGYRASKSYVDLVLKIIIRLVDVMFGDKERKARAVTKTKIVSVKNENRLVVKS